MRSLSRMTTTHHAQLAIRLSPDERRAAKRVAIDLNVSVSALARRALRDYLDRLARAPSSCGADRAVPR